MWYDDIEVSDVTWLGPELLTVPSWIQPARRSPAARFATKRGIVVMEAVGDVSTGLKPAFTIGSGQAPPVAFDAATRSLTGLTFNHTCSGTNRYLTVQIQIVGSTVTGTNVTYNGVPMTLISRQVNTNATEIWGLVNPTPGTNVVAITLSGAATTAQGAVSFTNVDQTTPLGTTAAVNVSGGGAKNGPSMTTDAGDMIIDSVIGSSFTVSAPTIQAWNDGGGDGAAYLPGNGSVQQTSYSSIAGTGSIVSTILNAVSSSVSTGNVYTDAATVVVDITPSEIGVIDYLFAERFLDTTSGGWGTVDEGSLSPTGWTQQQGPTGDVSSGGGFGQVAAAGAQTYRLNAGVSLPTAFEVQGTFKTTLPASTNIQGFLSWFYVR